MTTMAYTNTVGIMWFVVTMSFIIPIDKLLVQADHKERMKEDIEQAQYNLEFKRHFLTSAF